MKLILLLIISAVATPAVAQDAAPLTPRDVRITLKPNAPDKYFPEPAQKAHVEGQATALCTISDRGDLTNCTITDEAPAGYRFGDAVLRMASYMRVSLTDRSGTPTPGRRFRLVSNFHLPPRF